MLKEQLLDFFSEFLTSRGVEVSTEELLKFNFIGSGRLDSFELLTMIMEFEIRTGIKLTPEELIDDANATVAGLIDTLLVK
ncbi:hypothetical protein [Pseudoalteromonas sp. MMG012]|uniref:hypothetical protein n=1 Tax=Pseudoalteromonas sp. MMG012 TaxID=2822686 RepID=UPI001B39EE20|nr:hypothetical protein [Pseudoalteromonas sp. MMG012]MBQ4849026.1 hypothetical protein [Pseudoalteromonas sp. MMG012]